MGKAISEIIGWVNEVVPNKVNSTTMQVFLKELLGVGSEVYKFNTELTLNSTKTVANQNEYDLPSGVRVEDIEWLGVSNTTYNSTDVLGTTTPFNEYKYYGLEDEIQGCRYTNFTSQLSITPTPDDAYHMRIIYRPSYAALGVASSDSTTILNLDNPLIEYLQNKLAARVCKSGSFPRIDLGNNYEMEAESKLATARMQYYKIKHVKQSKRNISWKRWWS
jgi:hypothetical protein